MKRRSRLRRKATSLHVYVRPWTHSEWAGAIVVALTALGAVGYLIWHVARSG